MTAIYFDSTKDDHARRNRIYSGDIFVFSPKPSTIALCDFAREMITEAFHPLDPLTAQQHLPVEEFVNIFAPLKPKFIHHPKTKELLRQAVIEAGCELTETYLDVPRLRAVTSDGYLTSGVGYAHHPHRDTWYSAPLCQLNWWLPICDFESESSMAFHPCYWSQGVNNGSASFNYYEWNAVGRKDAAKHIKADTRKQPGPEEPLERDPEIRVVCPRGGVILFAAGQMHSTVPNTSGRTRFSIDFRTANLNDILSKSGAPNIDSHSPTTALRDFMRATDLARLPDEVIALYEEQEPAASGELIFQP